MKNASKSLVWIFGLLIAVGVVGLVIGISRVYQSTASNTSNSDESSKRLPKYNPWGVLAGVGATLCVLVFIKSLLDWFEKRDRRRAGVCPQCRGAGNQTEDGTSLACKTCGGAGRLMLDP